MTGTARIWKMCQYLAQMMTSHASTTNHDDVCEHCKNPSFVNQIRGFMCRNSWEIRNWRLEVADLQKFNKTLIGLNFNQHLGTYNLK